MQLKPGLSGSFKCDLMSFQFESDSILATLATGDMGKYRQSFNYRLFSLFVNRGRMLHWLQVVVFKVTDNIIEDS